MENNNNVIKIIHSAVATVNRKIANGNYQISQVETQNTKGGSIIHVIGNVATGKKLVSTSLSSEAMRRVSRLPAPEAHVLLCALLYNEVKRKGYVSTAPSELDKEKSYDEMFALPQDNENKSDVKKVEPKQERPKRKNLLTYIKEFLLKLLGLEKEEIEEISNIVVEDLEQQSTPAEFDNFMTSMFGASVDNAKSSKEMFSLRNRKLVKNAETALENGDDALSMAYYSQAKEILDVQVSENFEKVQEEGFKNKEAVKPFVTSLVAKTLTAYGIELNDSVVVTFNDDPTVGRFFNGTPKRINVDVSKVKSVTDLAMTIVHEVKHCADAFSQDGAIDENERRTKGLMGSFEHEKISKYGLKKNSAEYKLLDMLNKTCYYLDPNERSARIAEFGALEFMKKMAGGDKDLMADVDHNIGSYASYIQNEIVRRATDLQNPKSKTNLQNIIEEYNKMRPRLSDEVCVAIEKRIAYLQELCQRGFDFSAEKQALKQADMLAEQNAQQM